MGFALGYLCSGLYVSVFLFFTSTVWGDVVLHGGRRSTTWPGGKSSSTIGDVQTEHICFTVTNLLVTEQSRNESQNHMSMMTVAGQ